MRILAFIFIICITLPAWGRSVHYNILDVYYNNETIDTIPTQSDSLKPSNDSIKVIYDYFNQKVDKEFETAVLYKFTEEQVKTYTTIGGTPHLDLSYTVFGEVIEGLDIIDKIAAQKTDSNNRPLNEVRIIKMSIIP